MDPPPEHEHGGGPEIQYQLGMMRESLRSLQELVRERRAGVAQTEERINQLVLAVRQIEADLQHLRAEFDEIAAPVQDLISLRYWIRGMALAVSAISAIAGGLWFYFGRSLLHWIRVE